MLTYQILLISSFSFKINKLKKTNGLYQVDRDFYFHMINTLSPA